MSPRAWVPDLPSPGERISLDPGASHHLLDVLRVPRGAEIELFDGGGRSCIAVLAGVEAGLAIVRGAGQPRTEVPLREAILVQGIPRRQAWDRVLRMATELGATAIHSFVASRSVARTLDTRRWRRVVVSAACQCGRSTLPHLAAHPDLAAAMAALPGTLRRLVLVPGAKDARPPGSAVLLLGPEGGLSPEELALAARAGFEPAGLGRLTLRTDTAAAAALASLCPTGAPTLRGSVSSPAR